MHIISLTQTNPQNKVRQISGQRLFVKTSCQLKMNWEYIPLYLTCFQKDKQVQQSYITAHLVTNWSNVSVPPPGSMSAWTPAMKHRQAAEESRDGSQKETVNDSETQLRLYVRTFDPH